MLARILIQKICLSEFGAVRVGKIGLLYWEMKISLCFAIIGLFLNLSIFFSLANTLINLLRPGIFSRNRHCPKCQGSEQKEWVQAQLSKLLPVPYFHVVFTLPDQLNTLIYQNQKLLYSLLLRCAGDTITELARDSIFLGAQSGATVISVAATLGYGANFLNFLDSLYLFDWVVFCKKPFMSPDVVIKYLGRYTHRVAIANSHIVKVDWDTRDREAAMDGSH